MFDKKMAIWEINPFIGQNLIKIEEWIDVEQILR